MYRSVGPLPYGVYSLKRVIDTARSHKIPPQGSAEAIEQAHHSGEEGSVTSLLTKQF